MPVISYIDAITMALKEEMERDDKVFILGEDVGKKGGVFKATAGLYDEFGEDRVLDTPLAESAIAGVGIGAAMYATAQLQKCNLLTLLCQLSTKSFQKLPEFGTVLITIGLVQWLFAHLLAAGYTGHFTIHNLLKKCFSDNLV
ncbi:2-oxoisovalerate dehydrogenase subunit beta [Listeria monocytogenes FSL F6-684]|nr:2-oxoisovalerate dehydrogenase subunit beta [Listeria monocytogenes FSL F6-684]